MLACVGVGVGVGETWWDTINCFIVICDCEIFWLVIGSCDGGLSHCLLSGVGVDGHMGLSEEFELGEVNAYGVTNK